ncbi:MAG: 4Fe-4S dicluster domain-containing protein [Candidatus Krumholzibacteriota bacterium]|nr:4Fe-4S dicluster domain-containing protein [Candidatus Krumholzibacteriota bacterium]
MRKPKLRELKEALNALFTGPYTSKFPKVAPTVPAHFRGTPTYVPDECVGCGACGQVCPAGAIEIADEFSEEKGRLVRRITRDWGKCIFCSQCFVYCITKKGIELDPDFEKSTLDPATNINEHEKELLFCEKCGGVITAVDHVTWMARRLGELAFANQTFMVAKMGELKLVEETAPREAERGLERQDFIRILCPNCRASYILTDEWGQS